VLAILKAHRDLGPEFDSHLADQIIDLWGTSPTDKRRRPSASVSDLPGGVPRVRRERFGMSRVMPILGISIPLMIFAGHVDHGYGAFAVIGLDALAIILATIFG
jgi:hypothetical protein